MSSGISPVDRPSRLTDVPLFDIPPEDVRILGDLNAEHHHTTPIFKLVDSTEPPKLYYPCHKAQTLQTDENNSQIKPMNWTLPGKGEVGTREVFGKTYTCGDRLRIEACFKGDYIKSVPCHCHRLSCPICYPDTIHRAVVDRLVPKLQSYAMIREAEGSSVYLYHVVLSEPPRVGVEHTWNKNAYDNNRRTARRLLKKLGSLGGAMFFHPFRHPAKGSTVWREGPHYHCLAYFDHPLTVDDLTGKISDFHDSTGWICKVVRALDETPEYLRMFPDAVGGVVEPSDIGGIATYILSHVGVSDSAKSVSYFGDVSRISEVETLTMISPDQSDPDSFVYCPGCGRALYDYEHEARRHIFDQSYTPVPLLEARKIHVWSRLTKKETETVLYEAVNNPPPNLGDTSARFMIAHAFLVDPRFIVMDDLGNVLGPDAPFMEESGGLGMELGMIRQLATLPRRWLPDDGGRSRCTIASIRELLPVCAVRVGGFPTIPYAIVRLGAYGYVQRAGGWLGGSLPRLPFSS